MYSSNCVASCVPGASPRDATGVTGRCVEWTDAARADLRAISFHIADDSLDNALVVVDRLEKRAGSLTTLSVRGRVVPELRRIGLKRYRELIEGPWRLLYFADGPMVHVIAVVDSRRNLQAWMREQGIRFRRHA